MLRVETPVVSVTRIHCFVYDVCHLWNIIIILQEFIVRRNINFVNHMICSQNMYSRFLIIIIHNRRYAEDIWIQKCVLSLVIQDCKFCKIKRFITNSHYKEAIYSYRVFMQQKTEAAKETK